MTLEVISFDWDSTVADTSHRHGMIDRTAENGPDFWLRYSRACPLDTPGPAFPAAKWMTDKGLPWIIVSGRSEGARDLSMAWLRRYGLKPLYVFLCDSRHDTMRHGEWKALRMQEVQKQYDLKITMHYDDISDVGVETAKIGIPTILVHPIGVLEESLG